MVFELPELSPDELQEIQEQNKKLFRPEVLSANLLFYSTYIAIFEIFKKKIVSDAETFFWEGIKDGKEYISSSYKAEVLERKNKRRLINNKKIKNTFMASCDWAFEHDLLSLEQYQTIDNLIDYRNKSVHEMAEQIYDNKVSPDLSALENLIDTFSLYEYNWFTNVELAIGIEGLENKEISYEEFSKYNPFGLVWLLTNFVSMVELKEDGHLYLRNHIKIERDTEDQSTEI